MRRDWLTSRLCRPRYPYWLWKLLFTISPYHRGYNAGYEQAIKNVNATGDVWSTVWTFPSAPQPVPITVSQSSGTMNYCLMHGSYVGFSCPGCSAAA